ncbi:DUF2867 domain-containing protein [Echinimonas agarilytica]|uniref:SDR family oxidoreductase n=1 Tax=Echinimonas agarilytica TaxID=1215918 RepID=A0AA41W950_9GAMM|nr:DUF2867 domain-containing protein [Echinimonas agarilytica]MCM2681360.1 SDR family oxidoreductase [Echinimonas agarilytica]
MRILVIGAFGTIGRKLVPALVAKGHTVSVSSRNARKEIPWPELGCERYTLDLLSASSIPPALEGIDVIYYLMHGMSDGEQHSEREVRAAQNLVASIQQSTVKRIIYMGSLLSDTPQSEHMQARLATGKVLASSPIAVTELRAGIIIAPGSAAFEVMRDMVGNLPWVVTPNSIHTLAPPIALSNIVVYLTGFLDLPETQGKTYEATGPEWMSYRDMMERLAAHMGWRCRIVSTQHLPMSLATAVLGIVTSVPKSLAKALIEGLSERLQANPAPLQTLIPQTLVAYEDALSQLLEEETVEVYPKRWEDGVPAFRNFSHRHGFYSKCASQSITVPASAKSVWQVVNLLGGEHRYFYMDILWAMREWMDWCMGGNGRDHGRDDPTMLRVGERVDSWRILSVEQESLLVMKFGMKAPGGGGMQITIEPKSKQSCELNVELLWHPAGFMGLAYWYFYAPWHQLLLNGMTEKMSQLAMDIEQGQTP